MDLFFIVWTFFSDGLFIESSMQKDRPSTGKERTCRWKHWTQGNKFFSHLSCVWCEAFEVWCLLFCVVILSLGRYVVVEINWTHFLLRVYPLCNALQVCFTLSNFFLQKIRRYFYVLIWSHSFSATWICFCCCFWQIITTLAEVYEIIWHSLLFV